MVCQQPSLDILYQNKFLFNLIGEDAVRYNAVEIMALISERTHVPKSDMYLIQNGRILSDEVDYKKGPILRVCLRLLGGKGGFGSMLRAIGAQIEKTTNREACRDLSGRRLRDINEEQRLRKWLSKQGDRDKEVAERKKARLERLCAVPTASGTFADASYDAERSALPERINDAIEAGLQASTSRAITTKLTASEPEGACIEKTSSSNVKRPANGTNTKKNDIKKIKLWIDADLSGCSSGSEESDEEAKESAAA